MKEGADEIFVKTIAESGLGTIERLPKNCQATHVFHVGDADERVLPLKYIHESPAKSWNLIISEYRGVLVLWLQSQKKVFVVHTNDLTTGRTRTSSIINQYKVDSLGSFVSSLVVAFKAYSTAQDVKTPTKYKVQTREKTLLRPSTNGLEAGAHDEIVALVGVDHWKETPEKCRADAVFYTDDADACIPIQTKSCTFKKDGKTLNLFHNTSGYDGMILFGRPSTRVYVGTLVIPGCLAPNDITLSLSKGSKYLPYLVPDTLLSDFLSGLHAAIFLNKTVHVWPSGTRVDITDIKLVSYTSVSSPHCCTDIVERKNCEWRFRVLPDFIYETPRVQGTTVDVLMNGVRIQDKTGKVAIDHNGFPVSLRKNGKRQNSKKIPYAFEDFDALFVFLPEQTRYFFVIPSHALMEHGVLSDGSVKGKTAIVCYLSDYKFGGIGRPPDTWTQKFCFDLQDQEVQAKVANLLSQCKT